MDIVEHDGSTWRLKWSSSAHLEGEAWAALSHHLGDRFDRHVLIFRGWRRGAPRGTPDPLFVQ